MQVARGHHEPIVARDDSVLTSAKERAVADEAKEAKSIEEGGSALEKLDNEGCLQILRSAYEFLDSARLACSSKCAHGVSARTHARARTHAVPERWSVLVRFFASHPSFFPIR